MVGTGPTGHTDPTYLIRFELKKLKIRWAYDMIKIERHA
jgi:hypothetical protein